jgi:hypothetical protein
MQVAQFLDDKECVRTLSAQVASVLRNAIRHMRRETAGSAQEALSCLPGLPKLSAVIAATDITAMQVFNEFSALEDLAYLGTVFEQLSLVEMAGFPEHIREAALSAHSPQHCLQLTIDRCRVPFNDLQEGPQHQPGSSLQILQSFAPLLDRARVHSLVLSNCGMTHAHVQVR